MPDWSTFATIAGGGAGALIGLLFVAVSIRVDVIARSVDLRSRAAQTLILFVTALFIAVLLSIPSQPEVVLGAELVVLAVVSGIGLAVLDRRAKGHPSGSPLSELLDSVGPNKATAGLLLVAGALLLAHVSGGVYVLVACVLTATGGGVASAWLVLTSRPDDES